jgi:N-acetylglucosaminyldiphosphoundecaprenol N-acetyl-beta-D-mannosaminyltransferase
MFSGASKIGEWQRSVKLRRGVLAHAEILGCPVDVVDPFLASEGLVENMRAVRSGELALEQPFRQSVVSVNPELVMVCQRDVEARAALRAADLRLPDGIGVVMAARRRGVSGITRVAGIDFATMVLERAADADIKVFFLGGRPGVAETAAREWERRTPGLTIAGFDHGYFGPDEEPAVVNSVRASRADLPLLGLGAPKQEIFMQRWRDELGATVVMGVGGSFDIWSSNRRRAPGIFRRLGVEWLFRLIQEPWRIGRQVRLVRFFWTAVVRQA